MSKTVLFVSETSTETAEQIRDAECYHDLENVKTQRFRSLWNVIEDLRADLQLAQQRKAAEDEQKYYMVQGHWQHEVPTLVITGNSKRVERKSQLDVISIPPVIFGIIVKQDQPGIPARKNYEIDFAMEISSAIFHQIVDPQNASGQAEVDNMANPPS